MTSIRAQGKRGVSKAPQIANRLTICWAAKSRILQYGFFKTGVGDLAVSSALRDGCRD